MKYKSLLILFIAIICVGSTQMINAQGFAGPYDPANWTTSAPVGGSVNTGGAPANIIMDGPNSGSAGNLDYSHTFTTCATVTFDYSISHPDCGYDNIYYGVNGVYTFLNDCNGTGTVGPISLVPGDVLTFRINTEDGGFGGPTLTITNFNGPVYVESNDDCTGAIAITPGTTNGNTSGPCVNPDVAPSCGTAVDAAGSGLWYSYTPACSGTVTASLCTGTAYNTQLRVFTGTCGALVCQDGNDDFCATQSEVSWTSSPGVTYYILVHGNGTDEGAFSLNLTQVDAVAPVPDVVSLPTINSNCAFTFTVAPTATDNCAGAIDGTTPIMSFPMNGSYNVVWTYDDGNGNTSTQTQILNVSDVTPPVANLPGDTTIYVNPGECCAYFAYNNFITFPFDQTGAGFEDGWTNTNLYSTADDFQVPASTTWDITGATFDAFNAAPQPSSIIVYFYDDGGGYPGTVIGTDTILAANYTATAVGSMFGYTIYHYVFDLNNTVSITSGPSGSTNWVAFQCVGAGASFWEINSSGTYGNNALQVNGPLATANWTGGYINAGADHVYSLEVTTDVPYFSDACGGPTTGTQTAGLGSMVCYPLGVTTNSFTGADANGNSATYSFNVTVVDDQAPIPNADSTAAFAFTSGPISVGIFDVTTVSTTLDISGVPTILNSGDLSSVCIDITHTWVSDMDIRLISPLGTVYALSTFNGGSGDNYTNTCFSMSAASNIGGATAPFTGTFIPEGAGGFDTFNGEDPNGTWTLEIYDQAFGDQGTINEFNIDFNFSYPGFLPVATTECAAVPPTATDNCDTALTATSLDPTTFTADGVYTIDWVYTDASGNTAMQTQTIFVDDVTAPVADVASLPTVSGTCTATVTGTPTATDNCMGTINGTTGDPLTYNTAGIYTITWTYDDGRGNTTTQTQTVEVIDNTAPIPDVFILPNVVGNCVVTIPAAPTATDNCTGTITATTTDPITYNLIGTFFVIWHFDDGNGNTWTQNQTVVVNPCIGIESESGQEITVLVYPNPGNGTFTLNLSEMPAEQTDIRLVDALGQVIYSGVLQNQVQQFDFSHLASSTYYLLITNNGGHISKPIIINH